MAKLLPWVSILIFCCTAPPSHSSVHADGELFFQQLLATGSATTSSFKRHLPAFTTSGGVIISFMVWPDDSNQYDV